MIKSENIKILSIKEFSLMVQENDKLDKTAAILISSYDDILKKLFCNVNAIKVVFEDTIILGERSFNLRLAKKIHNFVDDIFSDCEYLYICCDSGQSRSAAIAAAMYRYLGLKDKNIWKDYKYHPNKLVYKYMCREYGIRVSNLRIKYYCWLNNISLKNKIKSARKYKKQ